MREKGLGRGDDHRHDDADVHVRVPFRWPSTGGIDGRRRTIYSSFFRREQPRKDREGKEEKGGLDTIPPRDRI